MARTYEYWTVKDGEDIAINLTVAYFSARKGNFSFKPPTPMSTSGIAKSTGSRKTTPDS
ncbi:hypothetical protein [Pseudomonas gorinensis]